MLSFAGDPQVEDGRRALLSDDGDDSVESSGGMFQEHASEFAKLRARAETELQALRTGDSSQVPLSVSEQASAFEQTLSDMERCRRQLQLQLKLEMGGSTGEAKQVWERKVQEWAQDVSRLRSEVAQAKTDRERKSLFSRHEDRSAYTADTAERRSAMQATETLERATTKLAMARQQIFESESVGQGVLSDLAQQRETLQNVRNNMRTVGTELTSARQGLDRMMRLAQQNRMITSVVSFILCLGLAFWGLETLGLSLKWNLILAFGSVILGATCMYLRRRWRTRAYLRESAAVETDPMAFHRAAF